MNIAVFIAGRFPTEKAYGITYSNTIEVLTEIGFRVRVFKFSDDSIRFCKRLKIPELATFRLLKSLLLIRFFALSFILNFDAVWGRTPFLIISSLWRRKMKFLIEVHQPFSRFERIFLEFFRCKNLYIFTINRANFDYVNNCLPNLAQRNLLLPMAVNDKFLAIGSIRKPLRLQFPLKMCYVGRYLSSGHEQGLIQVVRSSLSINNSVLQSLTLIGVGSFGESIIKEEKMKLSSEHSPKINVIQDLPHFKVPSLTEEYDLFVLPYPEGEFFQYRNPIKAMEYMALGKPIVANRTQSNLDIFGKQRAVYCDLYDAKSLEAALFFCVSNRSLLQKIVEENFIIAKQNSYYLRTSRALHFAGIPYERPIEKAL